MSLTFRNILVCIDHVPFDKTFLASACAVCNATKPEVITFLNVVKDFNLPNEVEQEFPTLMSNAIADREKQINALLDELFSCEVSKKTLVKQGNETKQILEAINSLEVDLVILGKKRKSDSVLITRITRRATCSVLVIPENIELNFNKILIPIDFSDYSLLSINQVLQLIGNTLSTLYLQNVYQVPSSYRYTGKTYEEFANLMLEYAKRDLNKLLHQVKDGSYTAKPVFTLDNTKGVIKLIYQEAKKLNTDLIVMGVKGRTATSALFIGSKAERMVRVNDSIPFLVIRKKGETANLINTLIDL